MSSYFDRYGLLHHVQTEDGDPEASENGILFTAEYYLLRKLYRFQTIIIRNRLPGKQGNFSNMSNLFMEADSDVRKIRAILKALYWDGEYHNTPVTHHNTLSHDCYTGLLVLLAMGGELDNHKINILDRDRLHPRDVVFYAYVAGKRWAKFLIWIPSIAMIYSCYKTKERSGELATSTKILAFVRCMAFTMPKTFKICTKLIEKNKNFGSWSKVFEIYFSEGHPNVEGIKRYESLLPKMLR